jgi:hypothetical protein
VSVQCVNRSPDSLPPSRSKISCYSSLFRLFRIISFTSEELVLECMGSGDSGTDMASMITWLVTLKKD